jgi:hypothetical protein
VSLKRGLLSLVTTIEKLLGRKSSDSGLETREYEKLALTSPTSGCRSVDIVHSRTQVTEFSLLFNSFSP